MGSMNEEPKFSLIDTVNENAREIGQTALGIAVMAIIIGALVAPVFAPLFESGLEDKYRTSFGDPDYDLVRKKMFKIKLGLWIFAGIAWIGLVLTNMFWKG